MKKKRQYMLVMLLKKSIDLPRELKIPFYGRTNESAQKTADKVLEIWGKDVSDWKLFYLIELARKEKES